VTAPASPAAAPGTAPAVATSPLVIDNVSAGYGDTQVLWDVSVRVEPGEIVALIGSNGAGKSTLLGAISAVVKTWGGSVSYGDQRLTGLEPDRIVKAGVLQVPQGRRLFGSLSVEDNLRMGAYLRTDRDVDADLERILGLLPRLRERYDFLAGRLSGGEQQQVAIARALMARPEVLLIDEMSLGLAPVLVDHLIELLAQIHKTGVSILIVEQDVQTALEVSTRAYVLETGRVTLSGPSSQLLDDPQVKKAYLGV
jgi:branched-chain amino acid transport system ATP-binding protein